MKMCELLEKLFPTMKPLADKNANPFEAEETEE